MSDGESISRVFRTRARAESTGFRTDAWREGVAGSATELRPLHPTLLHAFATAAKADAETAITVIPDDERPGETARSYRALWHGALRMAGALAAAGVAAGDRVLLVLPTSHAFVEAFFAVQLRGAVPVPSYPPATLERAATALERLALVASHAGAGTLVTTRALLPLCGGLGGPIRRVLTVEALEGGDATRAGSPRAAGRDPAFIQYTSGSTGTPKGVLLTHAAVVANIHAMGQAMRLSRQDSGASWLPLYHDMGLVGALLTSIYWRMRLVLMSPTAFLARPSRWLRAIARHRATISPAPNFAYAMCARRVPDDEVAGLDLSSWRLALSGAEPVDPATLADFTRRYAPHGFREEAFLPVYGLAECTLAASFPAPGVAPRVLAVSRAELARGVARETAPGESALALTSLGRAIPGHAIAILDERGEPLPERRVGHVVVSGPSLMQGYYGDLEATAAVVRDDALWTGDLGFRDGGELFVTGRAKDVIIVRGKNHHAEDLERVAARVPGVRPGGVVAFGVHDPQGGTEHVVLVCETRVEDDGERQALAERVAESVGLAAGVPVDEVVLTAPGTIPETPSGKPQRRQTRALYEADALAPRRTSRAQLAGMLARSGLGLLRRALRGPR